MSNPVPTTPDVRAQMRKLTVLARLRQLTGAYAAQVEAEEEAERRRAAEARHRRERKQRAAAEEDANTYVKGAFPHTLDLVVTQGMWQGYPAIEHNGRRQEPASAVAHLGQDMWLRHGESTYGEDVLELLRPCPCGRCYVEVVLSDELQLHHLLDEAARPACSHRG